MPRFQYRAMREDGRFVDGRMDAADAQSVSAALRARGHWTVEVRPVGESGRGLARSLGGGGGEAPGVRDAELGLICRELSALLSAGVPLDRALALLGDLAPSARAKAFVARSLEAVRGGAPLSDALEGAGIGTSGGRSGLIRAGEESGELAAALHRLAATIERSEALKGAIRSALLYPAVVAAAALGAIILLVVMVLPRFDAIFASAGVEMPGVAGAMLNLAEWIGAHALSLSVGAASVVALVALWLRSERGGLTASRLGLAAPGVGPIRRKLDAARFCRTLGLLMQGGAPAVEAAEHAAAAMGRRAMRARARSIPGEIGSGVGLAEAMRRADVFPPLATALARVGEESGAAPAMLAHAAELLEAQAERAARRAVQLIAPAATLLLGGLVALIVISMMTAMLSLNEVI